MSTAQTLAALLGVFVLAWVLFMVLARKAVDSSHESPKVKQAIKIDFDKRRDNEAKRIDSLEKADLLIELNRSRDRNK